MSFALAMIKKCSYGMLLEKNLDNVSTFYFETDKDKSEEEELEQFLMDKFSISKEQRENFIYFPLTFEEFCIFNTAFNEEMKCDSQLPFPCFLGYLFPHREDILEFCYSFEGYPIKKVIGLLRSLENAYSVSDDYAVKETLDMLNKIANN